MFYLLLFFFIILLTYLLEGVGLQQQKHEANFDRGGDIRFRY
jgi:hypothetical protein